MKLIDLIGDVSVWLVDTAGRIGTWLLSRADRDVCRWVEQTSDECPACPFPDKRAVCCHDGAKS